MTLSCVSSGSRSSTDDETGNGRPNNSSFLSTLRKLSPNGSSADYTGTGVCRPEPPSPDRNSPSLCAPLNLNLSQRHRHMSPSLRQTHEPWTYLAAECRLLLVLSLGLPSCTFSTDKWKYSVRSNDYTELQLISFASFLYMIWTHTTVS